jgi:hypothetical protein
MRAKIAKSVNILAFAAGVLFAITLFYGFFTYPYAPVRRVGDKFQDKRGAVYSEDEYLRFKLWERCLIIFGASTFVLAFGGQILSAKPEEKNSGNI